jgi:hypothetical protein
MNKFEFNIMTNQELTKASDSITSFQFFVSEAKIEKKGNWTE